MGLGKTIRPCEMYAESKATILKKFHIAVKEGNVSTIKALLQECTVQEKEIILNPKLIKRESSWRYRHPDECLFQDSPILFQALFHREIFVAMLEAGVNLFQVNQQGWNIIHYLAVVSHKVSGMEEKCVTIYNDLKRTYGRDELEVLLKTEDCESLRPLEFAVHLGCIKLFDAIFNTDGVYLTKDERKGFYNVKEYDITEYESYSCNNRRDRSPMLLLTNVDRKVLTDENAVRILTKGPTDIWANAKLKCNAPFIFIWASLRFLCILCFYVILGINLTVDSIRLLFSLEGSLDALVATLENSTTDLDLNLNISVDMSCEGGKTPVDWYGAYNNIMGLLAAIFYLFIYCFFSVLSDVLEGFISIFFNWSRWKHCFGTPKHLIASVAYYRVCMLIFSLSACIWIFMYLFAPNNVFVDLGLIVVTYVSTWSVMFFIQMLPYAGNFVNSIQKMLAIMAQFTFVYAIILIPFPHAFNVFLREEGLCSTVKGFETFGHGIYSVFRIMLNMIDLTTYKSPTLVAAYVLHIIYVFMVAILLVNFLIALMSSSVGEVVDAGSVIMLVQRLSVLTLVEWRLKYPFAPLYMLLHKLFFKTSRGKILLQHTEALDKASFT